MEVGFRLQFRRSIDGLAVRLIYTIAAGVIQNFAFTYELCWKFMKRWIEENVNSEIVDGVTRRELFRKAKNVISRADGGAKQKTVLNSSEFLRLPRYGEKYHR